MYNNIYGQPYGQYPNMFQQTQMKQEVIKVNGENGARAYQIPPNSSALLLDESGTLVWLVTTDGAGYKSIGAFDITPHKAEPIVDFSSLESRISRLEEMLNGNPSNSTTAESSQGGQPSNQPDKKYDGYAQKRK